MEEATPETPSKEGESNPLDETIGEIAPVSRGDEGILEGVAIGESYGGDSSEDDEEVRNSKNLVWFNFLL